MLDLIVKDARLPFETQLVNIAVSEGKIVELSPGVHGPARTEIDAKGFLVIPPFVDSHCHMDVALTFGRPRPNKSGTLWEGISLWKEIKPDITFDEIKSRALHMCHWYIAQGVLAARSHVDISDSSLTAVDALLEARDEVKDWLDLQFVAFPQDGYLRNELGRQNIVKALDKGLDVVGGIPHFERTYDDGSESLRQLCRIAADRGLMVDIHCDETDDPASRHIEMLAREAVHLGLQGRVTGSHLTSMHSMNNDYASKLISLIVESDVNVIANPMINITLQGRSDSYPKRRGLTRIKELAEAGANVAFGQDNVMDPFYGLGHCDLLDVAHMGLHVGHMTGSEQIRSCFDAITNSGAKILGLDGYGLHVGANADMVILQCSTITDALRLKPNRLYVVRRGSVVSQTPESQTTLHLEGNSLPVSFAMEHLPSS